MTADDQSRLVAEVTSAHRARDPEGRVCAHPAWHDLDAGGRREAFAATRELRTLEAALDPEGLTTTARAVLARIRGAAP
ncbi:MAG: hypothetical protein HY908_34335 [Myxococcales bacterium]|nr:hypothetical protein [Myxococcales bacterium]